MDTVSFWDSYHAAISSIDWYADGEVCTEAMHSAFRLSGAALRPSANVFHIGCGSSALGDILEGEGDDALHGGGAAACGVATAAAEPLRAERGVVVNVDFSEPVIAAQRLRRPASVYEVCDVRDGAACAAAIARALASHSSSGGGHRHRHSGIDTVVDKGTFDALLQKESCAESRADAARCLRNLVDCLTKEPSSTSASGLPAMPRGTITILSIIEPAKRWPFLHWALEGMGARREATVPAPAPAPADLCPRCGSCPVCTGASHSSDSSDSPAPSASLLVPPAVLASPCVSCSVCCELASRASPEGAPSAAADAAASPLVTLRHACRFDSEAFSCRLSAFEINCPPLELPTQKSWFLYLLRFEAMAG